MKYIVIKTETVKTTEVYETPDMPKSNGYPTSEDNAITWAFNHTPVASEATHDVHCQVIEKKE